MKPQLPYHLLLRFADTRVKEGGTIDAHKAIIGREKAVWFGKMGAPVSQGRADILNAQIQNGIPTFVYLVRGNRRKSTVYRGKLASVSRILPEEEKNLVPAYYEQYEILKYIHFWVKITEIVQVEFAELEKLRVASSVLPIRETLFKSSSGHFLLKEDIFGYK